MQIDGGPLERPAGPLHELLVTGLAAQPGDAAIVSAGRQLTWSELDGESTRLALAYRAIGLSPGDRLASLMPNRVELVIHYLACFKAGLVATPLNYRYTFREIDHALEVSGASALLFHAERTEDLTASRLAGGLALGTVAFREGGADASATHRLDALLAGEPPAAELTAPGPADPAAIFFTSGSTGPAKGVTHTHESLRWMVASAISGLEITDRDAFLPGSSMSHIGSFLWALSSLSAGARVVVARTYDAHEILPLLRTHQPTVLAMIPAALAALIRDHDVQPQDFACLRLCRAGADKVSAELMTEFSALAGFPVDEGYGMTEVGLATLNPPSGLIKQGSIGRPLVGFSVALRDEDDQPVEHAGEVGRIWIRTHSRMAGYWEAPQATADVLEDGWLDSGDLARADEDGYLWFFGRKKQIIVHDGSNISPFEVEGALMEHPAIELAAVIGIHDTVHGENVRAYVTLREGAPRTSAADLIVFCRERVGYKAPEEIVFLDEMPLNPTGKLDRNGLRQMAEDHLHPHGLDESAAA
ncbi:class I adenylate-forming enzyme family protein [Capillimicrobium parvum]|uniref:Long-chain-fatty-acid--CoA ligase n=1 Tax=Capillimicrobium parvum TaxID=2884022 RepID=A0A9E6XXU4_9ACTN|nr:class I adenylate-forming enzyme family protein [Capillimicrobium parvum]UGS36497.1 Long-chain-fatty-acid--CoA ligase [Capillimicrobium parvum]